MAANADVEIKTGEMTVPERLNDFIQKNRKILFIGLISAVVVIAALIAFTAVRDKMRSDALGKVDALNLRYEALRIYINSEEPDAAAKQADITALQEDLAAFENTNSGFAAARAYGISAGIYMDQKKWQEAEDAWTNAASSAGKTYLAPAAVFNAAVAAEERGDTEAAIAHYTRALTFGNVFPQAARAQFSLGRLEESRNNSAAALAAYSELLSRWPNDPIWSNLAQSRVLALSN